MSEIDINKIAVSINKKEIYSDVENSKDIYYDDSDDSDDPNEKKKPETIYSDDCDDFNHSNHFYEGISI